MTNAFFQNGVELFHPQRWHMCTPSLKEWAALSLMHNIGSIALEKSGQLAEARINLSDLPSVHCMSFGARGLNTCPWFVAEAKSVPTIMQLALKTSHAYVLFGLKNIYIYVSVCVCVFMYS